MRFFSFSVNSLCCKVFQQAHAHITLCCTLRTRTRYLAVFPHFLLCQPSVRRCLKMFSWRYLISLFWPVMFVVSPVYDETIDNAWMRPWYLKRFCDLVSFVLSVWMTTEITEEEHWGLFIAKSLVGSFLVTATAFFSCIITCDLFYDSYLLLKAILFCTFVAGIAHLLFVNVAYISLGFVAVWSIILLSEVLKDEVIAFKCKFDKAPAALPVETRYWSMVSVLKSSNNGYLARQFRPVKIVNFNLLDDPFWPNVSSIYVVEVRRRNLVWRTLTIWQVSILNGGKRKVCTFNHIDQFTDQHPFNRRYAFTWEIAGFQANGLILVSVSWQWRPPLFVYDLRHGVSSSYFLPESFHFTNISSISCLRRFYYANGSVCGWRIQILSNGLLPCEYHGNGYRSLLQKRVFDLRDKAVLISDEEVIFGQCMPESEVFHRSVRTSPGLVGVYHEVKTNVDGPSLLYDPSVDQFVHFANYDALIRSDRPFALYNYTPSPMRAIQIGDETGHLIPSVLTDQECIECVKEDIVFATRFKPSPIKFFAAKALFEANPNLRSEMSAEEFRMETGISDMQAHFDR